ncbi:MAG: glucuronate isomerase [Sphaerochaetaceae bacterium]|nr:glucuronate isomerase [Sphaerochaetaceae bacterium]
MKNFMDENFLLNNACAEKLYHEYAAQMPIFDYHCHLIPKEIADNKREPSITQAWLYGDHYKWRQMRTNGMDEKAGDDYQKFLNYADTLSHAMGNPLYHWSHLELQRYFGINTPLSPKTAKEIYEEANAKLATDPSLDAYGIFKKFNVYAVGTTDDPADSLEYHKQIRDSKATATKVIPSYRPDKAMNIEKAGFNEYIDRLASVSGVKIDTPADVMQALTQRLDFFKENGCVATDHGIVIPPYSPATDAQVTAIFQKARKGEAVTALEAEQYRTYILMNLAEQIAKRNMAMQLHMQCIRDNNTRQFNLLGPDTGYDAVADEKIASNLSKFMDTLDQRNALPKTILYSLNPNDYYSIGTLLGCFQRDIPGKIQMGSAWWFCDHIDGMTQQMKALGNLGLLSRFVGMLTDSRSFLSYPRHEYFRRILCNIFGTWMENGEIPADFDLVGQMVQDISFNNAQRYFENK